MKTCRANREDGSCRPLRVSEHLHEEPTMNARLVSVLVTVCILAFLVGALAVARGRAPLPLARVAEAATSCPISGDFFGCLLTGSRPFGWKVQNSSPAANAMAIVGQMSATGPGTGTVALR